MVVKFRKNKKVLSRQNILLSVSLGILLLVIIGFLINTNLRINRRRVESLSQIKILKEEIKTLEEQRKEMKEKISQATSKEYLEEVARNQLGLRKSGEEVVVVTQEKESEGEKEEKEEKSFWNLKKIWEWIRNK